MEPSQAIAKILRDCKLFGSLEPEQLAAIAQIARLQTAVRGERLFDQGQPCQGMFVVGQGQVKLFKLNPEGKEHILHLASPGQTFAEAALFGGFDYPASAEVLADAQMVFLPRRPMIQLLTDHPTLSLKLLAGMSLWLRRMVDLMESLVLRDAGGRVAQFLLSLRSAGDAASVKLPMKHQEIASHLGLTRETISRTLGNLESLRLIRMEARGVIRLLDPAGLAELAGQ